MNPAQLEQLLLLEQSGELSAKQRRVLAAELAASKMPAAPAPDSAPRRRPPARPAAPAPDAAARIAARLAPPRPPAANFQPLWKPLLAAAAALALLLGIQAYRGGQPVVSPAPALAHAEAAETTSGPILSKRNSPNSKA
jgi:hypothetical protein